MDVQTTPQLKKANDLFGSPKVNLSTKQGTPAAASHSRRFCCGLGYCMSMGSIVSTNNHRPRLHHHSQHPSPPPSSRLEQQVIELEKEVEKQKEHRAIYRKRMERTQDYLRYCLQMAQDNGFLNLIINNINKDNDPLSSDTINLTTPQLPPRPPQHTDLVALSDRAKINGWYIDPHEIEFQEKVAQGTTADIYKATWRGLDVAVKCIFPDFFHTNQNGLEFFAQELETLSRQRHRFILQLMGACLYPPNHGWIVTEFLSMTLKEWLHGLGPRQKEREVPLPPLHDRVAKALEISQAMQYLHEQTPKIIHRDLKLSNIFLDDAMHVRVADFGHARFLSNEEKALTGETGTYVYMAPEVFKCEPYDEKCDVYSFGIILNELITGVYPYIEIDYGPMKIALEVGEGKLRPALPQDDGELGKLIELIQLSWDDDISIRPSFSVITSLLRKILTKLVETIE